MRIKKIILQNGYKRFKKMTIDLGEHPKKVVALVGPNGSGKSSVFDGMLYLQNRHAQIGQFGQKDWSFHSMDQDPSFDSRWTENVKIEFDSGNFSAVAQQKNKGGVGKTTFVFRGPHRNCSNLNIETLSRIPDITENNIGASSTVDLDDKIKQNYQRLYSLIERKFKSNGQIGYEEVKRQIIGELNIRLKNILDLEISDHGDIQDGKGTLFFKKSDQVKSFDFNVLSSGEKEVVDILLDIFLKKESFNDSVYIIDEPELHINTGIQRKLLKEIVNLIPDNCQLWIATHSIGFLNSLKQDYIDDSDIIWFEGEFGSTEVTLTPIRKNRENWKKIFQTALEDLTGLLAPKTIIYCEGKVQANGDGSEAGIDAQIYNQIFSESHPDVIFVSSGGNTQPDKYAAIAVNVLNKAFKDVKLRLLKDMDINSDGSPTTEDQRNTFINENPEANRMLKRREMENYIFDFEILTKQYPAITSEQYSEIVTDVRRGNIKDSVGTIMSLCGITTGMNKEEFKLLVSKNITEDTNIYKELCSCVFSEESIQE
jgi:predicted ATPase